MEGIFNARYHLEEKPGKEKGCEKIFSCGGQWGPVWADAALLELTDFHSWPDSSSATENAFSFVRLTALAFLSPLLLPDSTVVLPVSLDRIEIPHRKLSLTCHRKPGHHESRPRKWLPAAMGETEAWDRIEGEKVRGELREFLKLSWASTEPAITLGGLSVARGNWCLQLKVMEGSPQTDVLCK